MQPYYVKKGCQRGYEAHVCIRNQEETSATRRDEVIRLDLSHLRGKAVPQCRICGRDHFTEQHPNQRRDNRWKTKTTPTTTREPDYYANHYPHGTRHIHIDQVWQQLLNLKVTLPRLYQNTSLVTIVGNQDI